jgi:hypothetical protein
LDWQVIQDIDERLEKRLGRLHARLRLGIEADHEAQVFGQGINYFHIENLLYPMLPFVYASSLRVFTDAGTGTPPKSN